MKKFFTVLVFLAIIGGGVYVFRQVTGVADSWVQDKATGVWVREGNPAGPAPRAAAVDCYTRAGRVYAQAVSQCVPQLCAADEVCINDLLDTLESLRGSASNTVPAPSTVPPDTTTIPPSPDTGEGNAATSSEETAGSGGGEVEAPTPPALQEGGSASAPGTDNESIRLSSPSANAALTSPFQVQGEVKEGITSVVVRIKGPNGAALIQETLTPRAPAEAGWRPFKITLAYDFDTTKAGFVEVVPQGGEAVSVSVTFQ